MILKKVADLIWGDWLVALIFFTGIYYTFILKGLQFKKFPYIIKKTFFSKNDYHQKNDNVTCIQALKAALGSCIGNGNIIGVVTAIMFGGPGALFWMWIAAFIGMAVKYGEIYLGMKYRERTFNDEYSGGPMYYISKGLNLKTLGIIYSSLLLIQNSGGTLIQGNVIKDIFNDFFKFSPMITSIIMVSFITFIILGGFKRLVKITDKVVPFMTVIYFLAGFTIIIMNFSLFKENFFLIFSSAFGINQVTSGILGFSIKESIRFGVSRGIYSNEAGEGTAAIFYAKITDKSCSDPGLYGIVEVFIDTILVCTMSGLIALIFMDYTHTITPTQIMMNAYESVHPFFRYFLGLAMLLFGITSIMGQWVLGNSSFQYIITQFSKNKIYAKIYNIVFLFILFLAPHFSFKTVWYIQDIALGLLILPNIFALIYLSKDVKNRNIGMRSDDCAC
ncbi:amino acid carrier protein [uncultured Fusobacterium sp.]|uniref:alanine/glycine:cation symporter family protein n=1 Tax=uncultured Fusobacterium sp. TaxID=159267 RepID=UPI0025EDCD80|nr:amino acid carrier protein [uncultured Fusobacterium sp.]